MAVNIHLAIVNIFGLAVLLERSVHQNGIAVGSGGETSRKRRPNGVERLVLGKHRVPQSVAHAPNGKRNASDNQKSARTAHCASPESGVVATDASGSPVYRKMPIHIASSAKMISKPAKSAMPPAISPYLISRSTQIGSNSEPSKSNSAQRRFQFARNFTYG